METVIKNDLFDLHWKLAKRIKQYEQAVGEYPPVEVLNEIRYAFRASMELLELIGAKQERDYVNDEVTHAALKLQHSLLCAYHDLLDGLLIEVTFSLDTVLKEYGESAREVLFETHKDVLGKLSSIEDSFAKSREKTGERRELYYEGLYDKWFDELLNIKRSFSGAALPKIIEVSAKKEASRKNIYRITLALGFGLALLNFGTPAALGGILIGAIIGEIMGRLK